MTIFLFFIVSILIITSSLLVITSKNPIHSVLFLILVFFNTSILFLFSNAEFLAMVVLIVYIGAVAVLFLFVIMMLDINISKLRQTFLNYLPIGLLVGFIILLELIYVVSQSKLNFTETISTNNNNISNQMLDNTKAIGNILYTDYFLLFQISGIILLVAMIGAIFLTIRKREGAKKQNIYKQTLKTERRENQVSFQLNLITSRKVSTTITAGALRNTLIAETCFFEFRCVRIAS